jgi:hypothetical protein
MTSPNGTSMRALEGVHDAARKLAAGVVGTEGQDGSGQREAPDAEALTRWLADAQLGHLEAKSRSWAVARVTCGMALFDGNVRQIEDGLDPKSETRIIETVLGRRTDAEEGPCL